ncbi:MAG: hypothetical protein WCV84_02800 [Patescibacteria group bacterium]
MLFFIYRPMSTERTIQDVLDAINTFASATEQRFVGIDRQLAEIRVELSTKSTKDQLERLHADLMLVVRKGNTKLSVLIEELESNKALDHATALKILALEPFPQY